MVNPIGTTITKNIKNITMGATIDPNKRPNLNQNLLKGFNIREFNNPKRRKMTDKGRSKKLEIIVLSKNIKYKIMNTIENVIPKFLLDGILDI